MSKWKDRVKAVALAAMSPAQASALGYAWTDLQYGPQYANELAESEGVQYPGFSACCKIVSDFWRDSTCNADLFWLEDEEDFTMLRPKGEWEDCEIDDDNPEGRMWIAPPPYTELDSTDVHRAVWGDLDHYIKG